MSGREPIKKSMRFEVFKRDKFTCQYCGAAAPDAVLHADHIKPVVEGGENDLLNLITSCVSCNLGKGAKLLSDQSAVEKQRSQLADLEERRQQIEMLVQWRDELQSQRKDEVEIVSDRIGARTAYVPNESGKADLRRLIKRFGLEAVLRATDESFDTYLEYDGDDLNIESWNKAFSKISGTAIILSKKTEKPYLLDLLYIQGIIRKRSRKDNYRCAEYLEHCHVNGLSLDEMKDRAKRMHSLDDFFGPIDAWLESIGESW